MTYFKNEESWKRSRMSPPSSGVWTLFCRNTIHTTHCYSPLHRGHSSYLYDVIFRCSKDRVNCFLSFLDALKHAYGEISDRYRMHIAADTEGWRFQGKKNVRMPWPVSCLPVGIYRPFYFATLIRLSLTEACKACTVMLGGIRYVHMHARSVCVVGVVDPVTEAPSKSSSVARPWVMFRLFLFLWDKVVLCSPAGF